MFAIPVPFPVCLFVIVFTDFVHGMPCVVLTIPPMNTTDPFRQVICFSTPLFPAVPPIAGADFIKRRMPFIALRTIPTVLAVRFIGGRMMRRVIGTVPVMRATFLFDVGFSAIGAVPALILRAIGTDDMVDTTGVAPPIVVAIFILLQNFSATVAIPPTVLTFFIQCMTLRAGGTIPGVLTRLSDVVSRATCFLRAIPAVRRRCGTDKVLRMVFPAGVAVPVVRAVFVRRVDLRARFAQTITVNVDIRSGVLHVGRSPIVIAVNVECIALLTLFAIPVVVARAARSPNTVALGANPISARADRVQRVTLSAFGAVPKVRAKFTDFMG